MVLLNFGEDILQTSLQPEYPFLYSISNLWPHQLLETCVQGLQTENAQGHQIQIVTTDNVASVRTDQVWNLHEH